MTKILETRMLQFDNKIISTKDAIFLAKILLDAYEKDQEKSGKSLTFSVVSDDGASFQSKEVELFSDDSIIHTRRIVEIKMKFFNIYNNNSISVYIEHASKVRVFVEGDDSVWVGGYTSKLNDAFNSMKPQVNLFKKHEVWLNIVLLLAYSMLVLYFLNLIDVWFPSKVESSTADNSLLMRVIYKMSEMHIFIRYVAKYLLVMILGTMMGGFIFIPWMNYKLDKLWPSIEIQIGPEHKFVEKHRRTILYAIVLTCIVPILISFIYDFIKIISIKQ